MMKRNLTAKFMALILCAVTLLNAASLYGCKKEEKIAPEATRNVTEEIEPEIAQSVTEEIEPQVARRVTNVYRSDFPYLPENYFLNGRMYYFNGRLYMQCIEMLYNTNTDYMSQEVFYSVDTKGNNPQSVPIDLGVENTNAINYINSADGSLVFVVTTYEEKTFAQSARLIKKAPDGSVVFTIDLEPIFPDPGTTKNLFFYYQRFLIALDGEGNIYLGYLSQNGGVPAFSSVLICLSPDGKKLFDVLITGALSDMSMGSDGRVFVTYNETGSAETENEIRYVDIQKKALGEKLELPDTGVNLINSKIYIGGGYDLYIKNDTGLYGVNQSETEPVLLVNWLNSDVNPDSVLSLAVISPDQFAVYMRNDQFPGYQPIAILTRVPDDEVTPKFLINLACLDSDNNLNSYIVRFNRQSNDYRIVLKDYSAYNTSQDDEAGANILKNEIAEGNIPDMLLFRQDQLPAEDYETGGMFVDLYEYTDESTDLSRKDLMECVMKPFERDGKLYQMVTDFSFHALAGKTANIAGESIRTLDEMLKYANSLPQGVSLFKNMTKSSMLDTLMTAGISVFIDYEAGTCSFENDIFIELLRYLNTLPDEINDPGQDQSEIYREDKVMLASVDLTSFKDYLRIKHILGDEDIGFMDFGARISSLSGYAISSKSPVKDGAWDFIEFYVYTLFKSSISEESDYYLELLGMECYHGFPGLKASFDNMAKQDMTQIYSFYSDGSSPDDIFTNPEAMIADYEAPIVQVSLTQEDVDAVIKYFGSLSQNSIVRYDENIRDILNEEVRPFFEGAESAEETAKMIQNRVSAYLSE